MLNSKQLDELESKISTIEDRLEKDEDFADGNEFQLLYNELIECYTSIKDFEVDAFPHGSVSEKTEASFSVHLTRFKKLKSRIKSLKDETDIEGWLSADWMFDKDNPSED